MDDELLKDLGVGVAGLLGGGVALGMAPVASIGGGGDSFDGFISDMGSVVDNIEYETVMTVEEDVPLSDATIAQVDVEFDMTTARRSETSGSSLRYKSVGHSVGDVILDVGVFSKSGTTREELKSQVEQIVEKAGVPGGMGAGYGVNVKDLDSSILGAVASSRESGPGASTEYSGFSVSIVNAGDWDASKVPEFIWDVQQMVTEEIISART